MSRNFGLGSRHVRKALCATSDDWTYIALGITDREPEGVREAVNDAFGGEKIVLLVIAACILIPFAAEQAIVTLAGIAASQGWFG